MIQLDYNKQISITEWLKSVDFTNIDAFQAEDNDKRLRLAVLYDEIGLPYDKPVKFSVLDINNNNVKFRNFFNKSKHRACAMRLVPTKSDLPKLRMRGPTVEEVLKNWYPKQNIDPDSYRVEFMYHSHKHFWSTIFIINRYGIFGEITDGAHYFLTQQLDEGRSITRFSFDFKDWYFEPELTGAKEHLRKLINYLKVEDKGKRELLIAKLGSKFYSNYLAGYFETVETEYGLQFIDYNRILGEMYSNYKLTGSTVSPGVCRGRVRLVKKLPVIRFNEGDILVCKMTTPDYIGIMKKAGAIVTQTGGLLSHAAITARELKKPCLVGYNKVTDIFKDGDMVEVDANKGVVRKI